MEGKTSGADDSISLCVSYIKEREIGGSGRCLGDSALSEKGVDRWSK